MKNNYNFGYVKFHCQNLILFQPSLGLEKGMKLKMEELVEKSKNGDNQAFSDLIINMENELYKIARTRLNNEEDIKEAVQETIIKSYSSIKKLKNSKFFKTWIIKILINECNNIYKKNKKNNFEEYDENKIKIESISELKNKIDDMDFYILINNLNYTERIVITLYYLEDFSTKEIAKILKEPEATIRTRLSRAKNKLKKSMNGGVENE